MKCIRNISTGELTRVSDDEARALVAASTHTYAPKHEWKAAVREKGKDQ